MCLPVTSAHLDCAVRANVEGVRDSSPRKRSHPPVCGEAGPDGRPVVWLSCERGMLGSHVSDRGRVG